MTEEDFISVTAGSAASDVQAGVYEVTLIDISEPRTILPQRGPNAGKEVTLRDWTFSLEDGTEVRGSASLSNGPKSKQWAWLTALLGHEPVVGERYPRSQLLGRMVLATVTVDDGGWARIANLSALPKTRPAAPGKPVKAQPVAAAANGPMPF